MTARELNRAPRESLRNIPDSYVRRTAPSGGARLRAAWQVRDVLFPEFVGLGVTQLTGGLVLPLVQWNDDCLTWRERAGVLPAVDRLTLRARLDGGGAPASSPVGRAVFVSLQSPQALNALSRLAGYGTTVALHLDPSGLGMQSPSRQSNGPVDLFTAAECEWRGISLVHVWDGGLDVIVDAAATHYQSRDPDASTRQVEPALPASTGRTNLRHEQLLDLAMRTGRVRPTFEANVRLAHAHRAVQCQCIAGRR